MPYLAIAASVSPPPAMLKALLSAMARAMASVPLLKASISKKPSWKQDALGCGQSS